MFTFEWLTVLVALAGFAIGAVSPGRFIVSGVAFALTTTVVVAASVAPEGPRLVLPHLYLVAGYWLPALMVAAQPPRALPTAFEVWLIRQEARVVPWLWPLPESLKTAFELAYLGCYPLLPITCALTWLGGSVADLDRFWTSVLGAGFISYGSLPWLLSRPPRAYELAPAAGMIRALNLGILGRVSHTWNTFPSGHVAVSTAAAGSLWMVWPAAGAVATIVAAAVGVGAAAGRYHYAIDVVLGFVLGAAAVVLVW